MAADPTQAIGTDNVPYKRIFLANLFDLVAFLCECSGDFMVDRFRNHVFPVIASQLKDALQKTIQQGHQQRIQDSLALKNSFALSNDLPSASPALRRSLVPTASGSNSFQWSDSERQLILSMIRCLSRVLQQEDCGRALRNLLSQAGLMLIPFLDVGDDFQVESSAMDCLKTILRINCDVLWRPLLELSGNGMPPCPLQLPMDTNRVNHNKMITVDSLAVVEQFPDSTAAGKTHLLAKRSRELMAYVETLPEQPII